MFLFQPYPNLLESERTRLAVMLLVAIAFSQGCGPPARNGKIAGGSMAPAFLGIHSDVTCPECGIRLSFETRQVTKQSLSQPPSVVCFNCGCNEFGSVSPATLPAERVTIFPRSDSFQRWEVIAFKRPGSDAAIIKRVAGLPGETLVIAKGNLWVDGAVLKKTVARQREMRILVNDSRHQSEPRWIPTRPNSSWDNELGRFHFRKATLDTSMDWLEYQPKRCYSHSADQTAAAPIEDNYGYNQSLGRDLNPVDEIFVEIEIDHSPEAVFGWRFDHRSMVYDFEIDVAKNSLRVTGVPKIQAQPIALPKGILNRGTVHLEFTTCDHQLKILIDNHLVLDQPIPPPSGRLANRPIRFGAMRGDVQIQQIKIWRDIFYLSANGLSTTESRIGTSNTGYLVLGDNAPVSMDCRHWNPPEIAPENILGRVRRPKTE